MTPVPNEKLAEMLAATEVECVSYERGFPEPAPSIWRIEVGGYCADFQTETAAANFANAIVTTLRSQLSGITDETREPWIESGEIAKYVDGITEETSSVTPEQVAKEAAFVAAGGAKRVEDHYSNSPDPETMKPVAWRWRYDDPTNPEQKLGWFYGPVEPPPDAIGRAWSGWECEPLVVSEPTHDQS